MASGVNQMSWRERIYLLVSVLTFLVSFIGLALSESVSGLIAKPNIVAAQDSINLDKLTGSSGYIGILNLENQGDAASKSIVLIIDFESKIPDYTVTSDEVIGKTDISGRRLRVHMDRLSENSNLNFEMFSTSPISYEVSYIDDAGKNKINPNKSASQRSLLDMLFLILIIISLLVIVSMYRRASESALIETLQEHQSEIQERLREVRDEIGNIEVVVRDSPSAVSTKEDDNDRSVSQRLADFISKF
tara:strand:- start:326 stop:1066 length:741 start_codon:yes stop_codon:yes gene_type:complete